MIASLAEATRITWTVWTIVSLDEAVPVSVLSTALYSRFSSWGDAEFADKMLSAMRFEFDGHIEKSAGT
jgi:6-phosphogluconate dehydrogenase